MIQIQFFAFLLILVIPYFVLSVPGISQTMVRTVTVSALLFAAPVAILWFGLKSEMIRPGAKLHQPQFDGVRPQIERNLRLLVLAFCAIVLYFGTIPIAKDLLRLAAGQKPLHITETVIRESQGFKSPLLSVGLSHDTKDYYLYYRIKPLLVGHTYEFVVLPQSRLILDYRPD